jgi:NTP pyrophosphatase (non-canonical NTP hydrolase)
VNFRKWGRQTDVRVLSLKLAEETGEVCKAVNVPMPMTLPEINHLLEEIDHCKFILIRMEEVIHGTKGG